MKYYIITYGCQMNKSDSERLADYFQLRGWQPAKNEKQADLVIINMCSVRQSAVDRVYYKIKNLKLKIKNCQIILAGCVLETDKKKFKELGVKIKKFKQLSLKCRNAPPYPGTGQAWRVPTKNKTAYVPIMRGCNNFCSYCVVPCTRGREWSRPVEKVLTEVLTFIKQGYKEIVLLGQNVNSYKPPHCHCEESRAQRGTTKQSIHEKALSINCRVVASRSPETGSGLLETPPRNDKWIDFADLLKLVNNLPGKFKIRFLTNHPKDMSDKLINTIAQSDKVIKEIHLPFQAGDNQILRKMNRGYTREQYLALVKKIKNKISGVKLSTDIIVGFPGETRTQFQKTVDVIKKVGFAKAYIAKYSPRSGTAAFKLKDNISPQEKKHREHLLRQFIKT